MSDRNPKWMAVLRAIKSGAETYHEIAVATGQSGREVCVYLGRLSQRGQIAPCGVLETNTGLKLRKWKAVR